MTAYFIGHRDASSHLLPALKKTIEHHITRCGVTEFWVGNQGRFDRMARLAVIKAKNKYPSVQLSLLLAYLPKPGQMAEGEGCDEILIPSGQEFVPGRAAILRSNQWAIDRIDFLIAFVDHITGGSYKFYNMRKRERRKVY